MPVMSEVRGVMLVEVEKKFRKLAMEKFGYGKGSLSKALEEALVNWINVENQKPSVLV
jgi:hypothetical protein